MVWLAISYQKQCKRLSENFHGLLANNSNGYGITHIRRRIKQRCEVDAEFFCQDTENVLWFQMWFELKKDVNDEAYPSLYSLNFNVDVKFCTCLILPGAYACAMRNFIQFLYSLMLQSSKVVDDFFKIKL